MSSLIDVRATFALSSGETAPTEFMLLKAGENVIDGESLLFDGESQKLVMATYAKRGIELMADYEHQSISDPPIIAPASAKKWTPEVRDGALYATNIAWTKKAKAMIEDGEYRYFSIAARVDAKTRRVAQVVNFALTNNPAAHSLAPLRAASITAIQTEQEMKTVLVALGLGADTDESVAVTKAAKLVELERDILSLSAKATVADALGALRAMAQSHEQVVALRAEVVTLRASQRAIEFDALVKRGEASAQITPAVAKSEWIKQLRAREDGITQLTAFLADAPKLVATGAEQPREATDTGAALTEQVTAIDIEIAKRMAGTDAVALRAQIDELKKYRADKAELKRSGFGR